MRKGKFGQKLLLALACLADLFEDLADAGGLMSFSYGQVYGFIPRKYKKGNFYAVVSRLLKIGAIEREIKDGQAYLKLSSLGQEKILEQIPLFRLRKKPWTGRWLVVVFDIPERESQIRRALREKLKELGFGMLQRSVWISPYDFSSFLQEFLENIGLADQVLLLGPTKIEVRDEKALAKKVFKLDKVNQMYKNLVEKWNKSKEKKSKNLAREIKTCYLEILFADPLLPAELLPKDWWGKEAEKVMRRLIEEEK